MKNLKTHVSLVALYLTISFAVNAQKNRNYDEQDLNISKMTTEEMYNLTIEQLLNIEVSIASKAKEKVSDAPGVVSVITKDELKRFGGTTLKDILERVPSLIGSTIYMSDRSVISSRGDQVLASSAHVLLLINVRPVRESLEGGIKSDIYESFPVNVIEKIEVIRGPGSVLYGSNAFSAVINVITESVDENNFSVSGLSSLGGGYGALAKGKVKAGDFSLIAAGRLLKKADWKTDFSYEDANSGTGYSTISMNIPNEGPGAYLEMNYKNLKLMSSFNQWKHAYFIADRANRYPAYGTGEWKKSFADLGYKVPVNNNWEMNFHTTYTNSRFEVSSYPYIKRSSYEMVGEWINTFRASENVNVVIGSLYGYVDGREIDDHTDELKVYNDGSQYNTAIYSQIDYKALPNLKIIGGFQLNKVKNIDLDIVPRGGVIWYPIPNLNVKALYSQAFRAPSINELYLDHPALKGNPNLKPEKVNTMDIGTSYQGKKFHGGINFFHSKQTYMIAVDRSGAFPIATYNNINEVTFSGIELEAKSYINQNLFLTFSALYQTNEDYTGKQNVTPIANASAKAGISYMTKNGLTLSLFDIYQGPLDEFYDSKLNLSPGAYNIMNFHGEYNMARMFNSKLQNLSVFMQVDNLTNREIWLPDWGLNPGKSMPVNPGRSVYLGLNVSIK